MSKDEAIEILSDMRAEYNIFGAENEATRYHVLSWAIQAMKAEPKHGRLVRCKDCVYWEQAKTDSGSCNRAFEITAYANDFCSYGERREHE